MEGGTDGSGFADLVALDELAARGLLAVRAAVAGCCLVVAGGGQ
jgi:hypothetical protein